MWLGTLDVGAAKLRLQFNITSGDDGQLEATMISLDQGSADIKCDTVTRTDKKLAFELKSIILPRCGFNDHDIMVVPFF